jgi:hypothetical protein
MKNYTIFTHDEGDIVAVGARSCTAAFIFSFLWLLWKGLLGFALLFMALECSWVAAYYFGIIDFYGFLSLHTVQALFIFLESEYFMSRYLHRAGYKISRRVLASRISDALYIYGELHKKPYFKRRSRKKHSNISS